MSLGGINRVSLNIFQREIKNIEKTIEKRKHLSSIYQTELEKLGFECQKQDNNSLTLFSCLCPEKIDRDKFIFEMRKKGVCPTRIWHTPIIIKAKADLNQFPNTIEISQRIINFPLQNFYKEKDIRKIIQKTKDCLSSV